MHILGKHDRSYNKTNVINIF